MNATQQLHDLGQSLWLDNITRSLLTSGTLARYINGWVSLEVSPLLADDSSKTIAAAAQLHARAARPNLFIKIPGTPAGIAAIEESIFAGVPINVTLLFSCAQYVAAAEAYLRGIERRIAAGRDPMVDSVASLFVSRWDVATHDRLPPALRNRLGIAVAKQTYRAYRELLASPRWRKLAAAGARTQRLLWASTGTKDPAAPDTLYIKALAAPETINTIPEKTLAAFADHGKVGPSMPQDGGDADAVIAECRRAGIDDAALALELQREGTVAIHLNSKAVKVRLEGGLKLIELARDGNVSTVAVDQILTGIGRVPAVQDLELEAAGVSYDVDAGIRVDDFLRTTNPRIFAAGDVCLEHKFTDTADASARIVVQNALFLGRKRMSALTIPWCTYTDPEVAHVGLYVKQARERNIAVKTFTLPMHEVDRAIADGEEDGFVKIHVRQGTDTILGATIVARHAGEMINGISLAMVAGIGLRTLATVIHAYPTQTEAIKIAADACTRTRLSPVLRWLSRRWLNR